MTREITTHQINPVNDMLTITVMDEPGAGGACHHYAARNHAADWSQHLFFQNGPITENGVNGITQEVLLAIVIDRLQCFQAGPFTCRENALALTKLEEAQHWLFSRTRE